MPENVLGVLLRQARTAMNRSLEEYAQLLGRSRESLSQWETGDRRPSRRRLRDIARVYGVSYDVLSAAYIAGMRSELSEMEG